MPACRERISRNPSSYLRKIYYDSVVFQQESLNLCVAVGGEDKVLYGSDYPHNIGDMKGCLARVDALPPAERDARLAQTHDQGRGVGTAPGGAPWNSTGGPATFNSTDLNENQNEQNYYGVVTYQKSAGDLNFQVSAFARDSSVHFTPDMNGNPNTSGDLFFNGVASDVNRKLYSGGLQTDGSYLINDQHTVRFGFSLLDETVSADSTTCGRST